MPHLSEAEVVALTAAIPVLITGVFTFFTNKKDNGTSEKVASIEHYGELAEKLSAAFNEIGRLNKELTESNIKYGKAILEVEDRKNRNEDLIEKAENLQRQLEVANRNIDDLVRELEKYKEAYKIKQEKSNEH